MKNCIYYDHKRDIPKKFLNVKNESALCEICNHYAHNDCICESEYDNRKQKRTQIICKNCSINENGERFPYMASKVIEGVIQDNTATSLTLKDLEFGKESITFDKMLGSLKKD